MKKLIIASAICVFPVFLLGIVMPIITFINTNGKDFNHTVFWIYVGILAVCLSVILTTVLLLQRYASKIDNLEKEENQVIEKKKELCTLISKYNDLIIKNS